MMRKYKLETSEKITSEFKTESSDEPTAEENNTVVWNLNDTDSADEISNESTDFTAKHAEEPTEEITFFKKEVTLEDETSTEGPVYTNRIPDEDQLNVLRKES